MLVSSNKFQKVKPSKIFFDQSGIEVVINNIKVTENPHIFGNQAIYSK